jgi:hypothetical protein
MALKHMDMSADCMLYLCTSLASNALLPCIPRTPKFIQD